MLPFSLECATANWTLSDQMRRDQRLDGPARHVLYGMHDPVVSLCRFWSWWISGFLNRAREQPAGLTVWLHLFSVLVTASQSMVYWIMGTALRQAMDVREFVVA